MRRPYIQALAMAPSPALGGSLLRFRPLLAVRFTGPGGDWVQDGLLDTGSDEMVAEDRVAHLIGLDLTGAPERDVRLVGRQQPVRCRYTAVELLITDGVRETYRWTAVVAFTAARLRYPLLGHGGFLQYFDVEFRGGDRDFVLQPNRTFPGTGP